MSHPSPLNLRVLHCLRLKGYADARTVAASVGATPEDVTSTLTRLRDRDLVHLPGSGGLGWALTPPGRAEGERLLGLELELVGARAHVEEAYHRFLLLNGELRAVCTAWQVHGDELNDHTDTAYDEAVVARLTALHRRARMVCRDLGAHLDRFSGYEPRLATALDRVRAGDPGWFTQPLIDSYHTVWFELHEDLLSTLGIDRAAETSPTQER